MGLERWGQRDGVREVRAEGWGWRGGGRGVGWRGGGSGI